MDSGRPKLDLKPPKATKTRVLANIFEAKSKYLSSMALLRVEEEVWSGKLTMTDQSGLEDGQ